MSNTEATGSEAVASVGIDGVEAWAMVETSPDGMLLADEHGEILLVNAQIESLFGYGRHELIGQQVEVLLPERHRQVHTANRTRYRADPKPRAMGSGLDLLAVRHDGSEFPVEVSLAPVQTPAGMRVVATVRDITDRLIAESLDHAVRHGIDAIQDGVFMFDADSLGFIYVNHGAIDQLGYTRSELLSMTPLHIKPDFTEASFRKLMEPLLDGTVNSHVFTTKHRRKDGLDVPVEIVLEYPPNDSQHQPRMLVALVRDITERLQSQRALEASEEAFHTAFDAAPVGIALVDFTDTVRRPISDCNEALCDLLGYTKAELLTKGFIDLTYPADAEQSDAAAEQAANGTRTKYSMEKRYVHADGHPVWVWVHSAVMSDEDGNPTRGMVHVADLTTRKEAETERERARQWLAGLAEIREAALADESLHRTLELVCRHACSLIGANTAVITRPDSISDRLHVVASDSPETEALLPDSFEIDGPLRKALAGESFLTDRLDTDDRVAQSNRTEAGALEGITAALVVPIRTTDGIDALLMMSHHREGGISESDLGVIESFAAEAATVIQLHGARETQSKLEVLEDRERLAQDLHDLVIQRLFASGMALQSVLPLAKEDAVADRINKTVEQLDETISELRSTIFKLNTPQTEQVADALASIVEDAAQSLGFHPALSFDDDPEVLPGRILEQLYPTLNEALANVARHAHATAVTIRIGIGTDTVEVQVSDNGVGITETAAHGHGLANLKARAQRVGGDSVLENNPDAGATLTWTAKL